MSISAEVHLLPLNDIHKSNDEFDCSDSGDDDNVGVTSNVDIEEDALIDMSTCLRIDLPEESYDDNDNLSKSPLAIGSACSGSDSENEDNPVDSTSPSAHCMTVASARLSFSTVATNNTMMMMITMKRIVLIKLLVR